MLLESSAEREEQMSEPLYDAIVKAIQEPLDGELFEQCVVDLLQDYYPGIRPLAGGNDAGQDGLYRLADGTPVFLITTTQKDYAANIRASIQSHFDAGGERRTIIVATSQPISGQRRESLRSELLDAFEVVAHEFHDRADFVQLLYRNSGWRKKLLGVPGLAGAVTRFPAGARPFPGVPIVGREEELAALRDSERDVIVVGKPGIGKTFLLEQLVADEWALFDALRDIPELEDAIRDVRPRCLIIDDAHLVDDDRIGRVLSLRREMGADFHLAAVTWPGQLDDLIVELPDADIHQIGELDRGEIIEVLNSVGLHGPDGLLSAINDQVRGRAGLAVTLARACLSGETFEVATGSWLLKDLLHWYERALSDLDANFDEIFGVLAIAGRAGMSTKEISEALGEPEPKVRRAIRYMASGGTIDEIQSWRDPNIRRLVLQPASLRPAAVASAFFAGPGSLALDLAAAQAPRRSEVGLSLTEAALRGTQVPHDMIRKYLDWADRKSVALFGCLGGAQLQEALRQAPQHAVHIASRAYQQDVTPSVAVRVLLDHARGPLGLLDKDGWDPLQVIARRMQRLDSTIDERRLVVQVAAQWLRDGGDPEVGATALKHALHPGIDDSAVDPGVGDTIQIVTGVVSGAMLRQLSSLWDEALEVVSERPNVPIQPFLDGLLDWLIPDRVLADGQPALDGDAKTIMRACGERAAYRLSEIYADRPIALRSLEELVRHPRVAIEMDFDIPPHIDALIPLSSFVTEHGDDWRAWDTATRERVQELAVELVSLSPEALAQFVVDTSRDLTNQGSTGPHFVQLLTELARLVNAPEHLLSELERREAPWECCDAFLERVVKEQHEGWEDQLLRYMNGSDSWPSVLLSLRYPTNEGLRRAATQRLDGRHAHGLHMMVQRGELDDAILSELMSSPDGTWSLHMALSLGVRQSRGIEDGFSQELEQMWRQTLIVHLLREDRSFRDDWRVPVVFEGDQNLLYEFLECWLATLPECPRILLPFRLEDSIAALPLEMRLSLLSSIPEDVANLELPSVIEALVSDDVEATCVVLDRPELSGLHCHSMVGEPTENWLARALAATVRGWSAADVIAHSLPSSGSWSGLMSERWQKRVDGFESLKANPANVGETRKAELIDAGVQHFTKCRDIELGQEKRRRTFGWKERRQGVEPERIAMIDD